MNKETGLTHIRENEPENRIHGARTLIKKLRLSAKKTGYYIVLWCMQLRVYEDSETFGLETSMGVDPGGWRGCIPLEKMWGHNICYIPPSPSSRPTTG